nr:hypothetical protein [Neobacillus sp. Marseille-Q6967]
MNKLSEQELLETLSNFPKHELSTEKRMEIVKILGRQRTPKVKKVNLQRMAAIAAMFVLVLIAPILYFLNGKSENISQNAKTGKEVIRAQEGDYFALKDENGKPINADSNYGIPNKVSLLAPVKWIAKDKGSLAKMMVFLWGDYEKDFANKILKVNAVHVKTGVTAELAEAGVAGPHNGADAHVLTSFNEFAFPGVWNLEFSVGDKKVGEFSVYVKEPYVKVGNSTILISQEDLYAGFYEDVIIEVEGSDLPSEIKLQLFELDNAEVSEFTFKDKTDFTTTAGKNISTFTGDFLFKKSGKYRLTILQQSEAVEVRKPLSK